MLLFSGLVTCSGVFGSPLTDDVATLETLVRSATEFLFRLVGLLVAQTGFRGILSCFSSGHAEGPVEDQLSLLGDLGQQTILG